eukprot:m.229267 g.229267  ORF g.229267 m.229267 type:complete len:68 (+) comp15206_c1_seq5:113-316(+)
MHTDVMVTKMIQSDHTQRYTQLLTKGSTTLSWKLRQFRGDQTKGSAPIKRASQSSVTQCICAHARVC